MNPDRRQFLTRSSVAFAALGLGACASTPAQPKDGPDSVVDASFTGKAGSLINGRPTYQTVQQALDAAPVFGDWWVQLKPGRYVEKITVMKNGLRLTGEDRERCILSFDAYAGQVKPTGGFWGTDGSATLTIRGTDFSAENLTIENSFDYLGNMARDRSSPDFIRGSQALAVYIGGQADRCSFRNVNLLGYQDTLCPHVGRSYFERCLIAGNVDFIFGGGQAWFEECELRARPAGYATTKVGYLTAPSTHVSQKYGFIFNRCRLSREAGVPDATVALGRPWHPNGAADAIGQSVFLECWMDAHITAEGWDSMSSTTKTGERVTYTPEQSRFFEYRSSGPGAAINARRRQLTDAQLADFTRNKLLGSWRP
ncbi:pectinesterase family protein [Uliginosibacterium sp. 31-12]|uniref:pectinesterase family protein n=1 Tax=Uliginosibacterium sp. 31-12 TaxID=3062781 RepID=UPI0026E3276C|nr:pectinesterase family protein [Uliginosibacterium sp. 31-12]MDO6388369.1 pectinesterase family protein [Uliginosibacterium sp. 31-12]